MLREGQRSRTGSWQEWAARVVKQSATALSDSWRALGIVLCPSPKYEDWLLLFIYMFVHFGVGFYV